MHKFCCFRKKTFIIFFHVRYFLSNAYYETYFDHTFYNLNLNKSLILSIDYICAYVYTFHNSVSCLELFYMLCFWQFSFSQTFWSILIHKALQQLGWNCRKLSRLVGPIKYPPTEFTHVKFLYHRTLLASLCFLKSALECYALSGIDIVILKHPRLLQPRWK